MAGGNFVHYHDGSRPSERPPVYTMTGFVLIAAWIGTVLIAGLVRRNPAYAIFVAVALGITTLSTYGVFVRYATDWWLVGAVGQAVASLHFIRLARPRLRPLWYRASVSVPGLTYVAGAFLALPFAAIAIVGLPAWGWPLPFALALVGAAQSFRNPERDVALLLDATDVGETVRRLPRPATSRARDRQPPATGVLRIAQITDPHLGPFMSPERLRRICERAVAGSPDLVLVTGDLLTMESQRMVDRATFALEPLAALADRTFFCFGNHDHEDRTSVRQVVERLGATLLVDEAETVTTRVGPVEVIGADWRMRGRAEHLQSLAESLGRTSETFRVLMLHDPGAFKHVPDGFAELTLSGHTHGGHVGLVSLGFDWTAIGGAASMPDHGLWGRGTSRLYVHRGTGHYGYPVRLGVPGEEGMLEVRVAK